MKVSRRNAIFILAGTTAAVALSMGSLPGAPVLYGDGIHDDAPALNALVRGKPVIFSSADLAHEARAEGGTLHLPARDYAMGDTLVIDADCPYLKIYGNGMCLRSLPQHRGFIVSVTSDGPILSALPA